MSNFTLALVVINLVALVVVVFTVFWVLADLREYINLLSDRLNKHIDFNDLPTEPPTEPPKSYVIEPPIEVD